jgi:cytochrome b involved in lipid metabolism
MKKLTGISLFIFFCVVTAILTAGLVFYQNNKNTNTNSTTNPKVQNNISKLSNSGVKILETNEVAKHNTISDCWMIINNKVYDVSNYASAHPGGVQSVANYCGKEATEAFNTKGGGRSPHSNRANQMLTQFFVGNLQ